MISNRFLQLLLRTILEIGGSFSEREREVNNFKKKFSEKNSEDNFIFGDGRHDIGVCWHFFIAPRVVYLYVFAIIIFKFLHYAFMYVFV
jgi:hypothetical protein